MREIIDYIDRVEDRLKAYKDFFNMLIHEIAEIHKRLEVIEDKLDIVPFPEVDENE